MCDTTDNQKPLMTEKEVNLYGELVRLLHGLSHSLTIQFVKKSEQRENLVKDLRRFAEGRIVGAACDFNKDKLAGSLHSITFALTNRYLEGPEEKAVVLNKVREFIHGNLQSGCGDLCYHKEQGCVPCTAELLRERMGGASSE